MTAYHLLTTHIFLIVSDLFGVFFPPDKLLESKSKFSAEPFVKESLPFLTLSFYFPPTPRCPVLEPELPHTHTETQIRTPLRGEPRSASAVMGGRR